MKKLAVLGGSYLQLPLVKKAKSLGVEVHCFAWDSPETICKHEADFFYPISVMETDQILEVCQRVQVDGITTIATDICIPVINTIAAKMGLVGNSPESGVVATNKYAMRQRFVDAGVRSPRFMAVESYDKALNNFAFPVIIKPTDRSGSRGVTRVDNPSDLKAAIENAATESLEHKAIVEEFVDGREVSVESISWKGKHYILTITDKVTTGAPSFVELEHHQPSQLPAEIQEKIREQTLKALDALGVEFGAGHAEFKITDAGEVVAIELGARMGGDFIGSHLVELSTGYDFLKGVIDVALNRFTEPEITNAACSGVYFLSAESKHLLPYFEKSGEFEVEKQVLRPELVRITNSNDRSGYLIYRSAQKIIL
jgi:biotin carboxylase